MDYASKELSEELFKLSGWKTGKVVRDNPMQSAYNETNILFYEYDLGFLLRKLPDRPQNIRDTVLLSGTIDGKRWSIAYRDTVSIADTPEDAVCSLAIQLIKQGILEGENKTLRELAPTAPKNQKEESHE